MATTGRSIEWLIGLLLFGLALWLTATDLAHFVTADEHNWVYRSGADLLQGLSARLGLVDPGRNHYLVGLNRVDAILPAPRRSHRPAFFDLVSLVSQK